MAETPESTTPRHDGTAVVVMGVSGSGKSTLGARLAEALGAPFYDADDLHLPESVAKMASGVALTDVDREPWLRAVGAVMANEAAEHPVIACSALRRDYRNLLRATAHRPVLFLHLDGPDAVLGTRMAARPAHFMPTSLLESQRNTLEPLRADEEGWSLDTTQPLAALVERARGLVLEHG